MALDLESTMMKFGYFIGLILGNLFIWIYSLMDKVYIHIRFPLNRKLIELKSSIAEGINYCESDISKKEEQNKIIEEDKRKHKINEVFWNSINKRKHNA